MGWFDEQIRERKKYDDELFSDAFADIAGAVLGTKLSETLNDDRIVTKNAVDEVLKYYHIKPAEVPDEIKDADEQIEYLLRPNAIMRRTVHLDENWFKNAVGPMMGSVDGKVVPLIPKGLSGYCYKEDERWIKINSKNAKIFDKEALAFYNSFPSKKMTIVDLVKFSVGTYRLSDVLLIVFSMLAVTLVGMLIPEFTEILFSDVIESESYQMLAAISILFISVTLSVTLFGIVSAMYSTRATTKMNVYINAATMMRMLTLPTAFFKKFSAGELSSRINLVSGLSSSIVSMFLTTGLTSVFSLLYVAQIYQYAPSLVVPSLVMTSLTVILTITTSYVQMGISKKKMEYSSKEQGMTYSLLTGITKIKLSGAEKRAFSKWAEIYSKSAKLEYSPPLFLKVNNIINTGITLLGTLVMYYFAVDSGVSVSEYYAFTAAYGMVSAAFMSLASIATSFATIKPTLEMIKPILDAEPEVSKNKEYITRVSGGIELNNVSFKYTEDMPLVLDNLSIKIRSGQYVAIVGKTGCGKSTLLRLMLGFETPQKGSVYYDGKDLKKIDLKSLRQKIGVVMQNGKLFQSDIFSNIVISAPGATLDDAWKAAEIAGIKKDIEEMPMGMFTVLSEGQGGISGGQKQRLMIARAIASKPKILFFDEATSALDNVTQKQVSDSLDALKCTRIVIAHRISTIKHCDRIIVLDKGKIIEDGNYQQLIKNDGYFSELVARQMLDTENKDEPS